MRKLVRVVMPDSDRDGWRLFLRYMAAGLVGLVLGVLAYALGLR